MRTHEHEQENDTTPAKLDAHRHRLAELCDEVASALRADDRPGACDSWTAMDLELTAQMATEESELLPRFAKSDPFTERALREEHLALRRSLAELGIAIDLKRATQPMVQQFFARVSNHAERERALLAKLAAPARVETPHRNGSPTLFDKLRRFLGR